MSHTIEDIKHMFSSRDTTVYIFTDKRITIENSLVEGGKIDTYKVEDAETLLRQIIAFGDEIPHGVFAELEKL
jgi:hypothetical protein